MKIAFVTSAVYPSPTANRIHILAMATAFAKKGFSVDLFCQRISGREFPQSVTIIPLGTNRSISSAWKYSTELKKNNYKMWFVREPHLLLLTVIFYLLKSFKIPPLILYEVHDLPRDRFDALALWVLCRFKKFKVITITHSLSADLFGLYKVPKEHILVVPDGVDLELFTNNISQVEAKSNLNVGLKPLIVYSGSLFPWKGVYTLLDAARLSPEIEYWFIGGYEEDIKKLKAEAKGVLNVKIVGYVPHETVSQYLTAADILVLPNSGTYRMSDRYTSPLKLFEYMASKRPIVASDLSSIREILDNEKNAYLVKPDDPKALVIGIQKALTNPDKDAVVAQAFADVKKYSWDNRVEIILTNLR